MSNNFLQLNNSKTEILVVGPIKQRQIVYSHLDSLCLKYSEQVKNLKVITDADISWKLPI